MPAPLSLEEIVEAVRLMPQSQSCEKQFRATSRVAWPRLGEHSVLVGVQDRIAEQMVDFLVFRTRQVFVEAVLEPMSVERIKDRIGKQMANFPGLRIMEESSVEVQITLHEHQILEQIVKTGTHSSG